MIVGRGVPQSVRWVQSVCWPSDGVSDGLKSAQRADRAIDEWVRWYLMASNKYQISPSGHMSYERASRSARVDLSDGRDPYLFARKRISMKLMGRNACNCSADPRISLFADQNAEHSAEQMHASGWMGHLIAFSLIKLLSSPLMGRLIAFSLSRLLSSPLSDSLSGPQPSEKGLSDGQRIGALLGWPHWT